MKVKTTTEDFIKKAKQVHGDKYDYSKTTYIKSNSKLEIICPEHGSFFPIANNHLMGSGCPVCKANLVRERFKDSLNSFIKKAKQVHGDKYDYSKVEYKNSETPVCIICPVHGEFWQKPHSHLLSKGCSKCSKVYHYSTEEWIKKAKQVHGDKYDYSKVVYINSSTKVCIICPIHGEFWQKPNDHLNGHGCSLCQESMGEKKIRTFFENSNLIKNEDYYFHYHADWLGHQHFDCFLPKKNIAIEYDGRQHFMPVKHFGGEKRFKQQQIEDAAKNALCEEKGIKLIRIPYTNLKNINSILTNILLGE